MDRLTLAQCSKDTDFSEPLAPRGGKKAVKDQVLVSLAVAKERGDPAAVGFRVRAGSRTRGTGRTGSARPALPRACPTRWARCRTLQRRARPQHRPAAAGAASAVRPVVGRERVAHRAKHGGPPGAGGEALAAGALVSRHLGSGGLGRARTRVRCDPRPGLARKEAGALAQSFFSS